MLEFSKSLLMLTKYNIYNYLVKAMRREFISFNSGFRIDTGLQFPPILSPEPHLPVPLFIPSKFEEIHCYIQNRTITCYLHYLTFYMKVLVHAKLHFI